MPPYVEIDKYSGFCFGVEYAIQRAEELLNEGIELYCLGKIVHNDKEVERLTKKGLKIIDHSQYRNLKGAFVLIRAHGEPPETYRIAKENNISLIDTSCPVVLKLQNRIHNGYIEAQKNNGQIVIFGEEGHAEVNGLVGQTNNNAIIIGSIEDIFNKLDFSRPIYLFSQTTRSPEEFKAIIKEIEKQCHNHNNKSFHFHNTICSKVSQRAPKLKEFAARFDIILFVSDKNSSNGKFLFSFCKAIHPKTYFITQAKDIQKEWIEGAQSVGISGATSTPMWLMKEVKDYVEKVYQQQ